MRLEMGRHRKCLKTESRRNLKSTEGNRRERDSNPRNGFPFSGFQDRRLQPLGHLSVVLSYARSRTTLVCNVDRKGMRFAKSRAGDADWLESRQREAAAATTWKLASGAWRSSHGRIARSSTSSSVALPISRPCSTAPSRTAAGRNGENRRTDAATAYTVVAF